MNCEEHKNEELAHCPACLANYWKSQYLMAKNDIEAAVLAEREACAKVASKAGDNYIGAEIAAAIRAEAYQKGRDDMKKEAAKWFEGYDNQAWFELTQEEAAAAIRGLK